MPPETERGAMVFAFEPINTPESASEDKIVLPVPAAVNVSLLLPVVASVGFVPASEIVEPFTVKLPPKVVSPVPVVTAPLLTVLRFSVPVPAESVRLLLLVVAIVEAPPVSETLVP